MAREALSPNCPQCGGPVEVPEGAVYAHCTFCSAESFVDLTGALLTQVIRTSVGRGRVPGLVRARAREAGWADVTIADIDLVYEPVWELESESGARLRIGARPGPQGRFEEVNLPGGERALVKPGEREGADEWIEPELAPDSLAEVAARLTDRPVSIKTIRLVHRPIYSGRIRIDGQARSFRIDAVGGDVLNVDWPVRSTYRRRNQLLMATVAMVAIAALLPLPVAAAAVVVIGGLTAWNVSRQSAPRRAAGT